MRIAKHVIGDVVEPCTVEDGKDLLEDLDVHATVATGSAVAMRRSALCRRMRHQKMIRFTQRLKPLGGTARSVAIGVASQRRAQVVLAQLFFCKGRRQREEVAAASLACHAVEHLP